MIPGIPYDHPENLLKDFLLQKEAQNKFQQLYFQEYRGLPGYDPIGRNGNSKDLDDGATGLRDGREEKLESG